MALYRGGVEIHGSRGYYLDGVETTHSAWSRFRGLMLRPPMPLLLRTSMVHGFWLTGPLWAVGVAKDGTVTHAALLRKRRMVWLRRVAWILELPPDRSRPQPGERLAFVTTAGEAVLDARTSLPLRHAHRQPG